MTMDSKNLAENYSKLFNEAGAGKFSGPSADVRLEAANKFIALGFPGKKNEEWKYTDITGRLKGNLVPSFSKAFKADHLNTDSFIIKDLEVNLIVFVSGNFIPSLSKIKFETEKFSFSSGFSSKAGQDLVERSYSNEEYIKDGLYALNTAYATDGAIIEIPDNTDVAAPFHLLFINETVDDLNLSQARNIFSVGKNSSISIIETSCSADSTSSAYFFNNVNEIFIGANSQVRYQQIQNTPEDSVVVDRTKVWQDASSRFYSHVFSLNGGLTRNDLVVSLNGKGAESHLYGLYMAGGNSHIDNHTLIDHAVPECSSDEMYKGIINGSGRGVFNGKVIVRKDAQKTNAYQSNKNMLLSEEARIDTKPQLEIFADDVKCSHGAAIGRLDEEALFYLRARGVGLDVARGMLVEAFANEVIESVGNDAVAGHIKSLI